MEENAVAFLVAKATVQVEGGNNGNHNAAQEQDAGDRSLVESHC